MRIIEMIILAGANSNGARVYENFSLIFKRKVGQQLHNKETSADMKWGRSLPGKVRPWLA